MESIKADVGESLSLREAAEVFGVSVDTLRRRIKDDRLPEVESVQGQYGSEYRLPISSLKAVSEREGWAIGVVDADSTAADPMQTPAQAVGIGIPEEILDRLLAAEGSAAGSAAELNAAQDRLRGLEAQLHQARNDLEHERSESERLRADLAESAKTEAVATARTEEVKARIADLEREVARATENQAELELARETSAAATQAAEQDRDLIKAEAAELSARVDELEQERHALERARSEAEASLGWLGRRRLKKASDRT